MCTNWIPPQCISSDIIIKQFDLMIMVEVLPQFSRGGLFGVAQFTHQELFLMVSDAKLYHGNLDSYSTRMQR